MSYVGSLMSDLMSDVRYQISNQTSDIIDLTSAICDF